MSVSKLDIFWPVANTYETFKSSLGKLVQHILWQSHQNFLPLLPVVADT